MELFLVSILRCLLLVYRNTTNFSMLLTNFPTLLSLLTLVVFCGFFGFSIYKIRLPSIEIVYFFLSNLNAIGLFSCLISLAGIYSITLNSSSQSKHPCLIPDPKKKAFCLCWVKCYVWIVHKCPLSG